jgi:predicted nucleic acid-binding protein
LNTLIDTSVWSLSLRRDPADLNSLQRSILAELTELIHEDRACLIGLIRQEILSGVRSPTQFERLRVLLRTFRDIALDAADYEAAAQASNQCASKGITISVVDALICAVALRRDCTIFTTDSDFEHHARILSIKLHKPRK